MIINLFRPLVPFGDQNESWRLMDWQFDGSLEIPVSVARGFLQDANRFRHDRLKLHTAFAGAVSKGLFSVLAIGGNLMKEFLFPGQGKVPGTGTNADFRPGVMAKCVILATKSV